MGSELYIIIDMVHDDAFTTTRNHDFKLISMCLSQHISINLIYNNVFMTTYN